MPALTWQVALSRLSDAATDIATQITSISATLAIAANPSQYPQIAALQADQTNLVAAQAWLNTALASCASTTVPIDNATANSYVTQLTAVAADINTQVSQLSSTAVSMFIATNTSALTADAATISQAIPVISAQITACTLPTQHNFAGDVVLTGSLPLLNPPGGPAAPASSASTLTTGQVVAIGAGAAVVGVGIGFLFL